MEGTRCGTQSKDPWRYSPEHPEPVTVTLQGKWDFVDVTKLRALRGEIILDYLGEPNRMTFQSEVRQREMWLWNNG